MNPTNYGAPSDVARYVTTDYRPSKTLYVPVKKNQNWRLFMQRNGKRIQNFMLDQFKTKMNAACEPDCARCDEYIKPFDSSDLDERSWTNLNQPQSFHHNMAFIPQVNQKNHGLALTSNLQKPYPSHANQQWKCPVQNPIRQ